MAFLIGDVTIMYAEEKSYDGRKYFRVQALAPDKATYIMSTKYEDQPKVGDTFQMFVAPDANFKPKVRLQKVK